MSQLLETTCETIRANMGQDTRISVTAYKRHWTAEAHNKTKAVGVSAHSFTAAINKLLQEVSR